MYLYFYGASVPVKRVQRPHSSLATLPGLSVRTILQSHSDQLFHQHHCVI